MMAGLSYLDRARVKVVGLDTFAQNPVSVSLYLKLGFQIVGGLLMLHAPRESLQVLDMEIPPESLDKFQWGPLERRDLSSVARMELAATGFQRRQDFEFLLDSGLGAGFAVRGGKEIAGYAFTSIRRKSGFISPIHLNPRCTKPELVTKLLLSACADWLEGKINGDALTFCRGDELRMLNILLNAGFRLRATMLTMHRTGAIGKGPVRTPYSIEKG
jgi:ribosomal protein S18 acetylase RimI-like enzyme